MIARVLSFSVHQRWLVALLTVAAAAFGIWSMTKLPIDAVPDITNKQVQINAIAPALSPIDVERQVTYPLETALSGIRGFNIPDRCHATDSLKLPRSSTITSTSILLASRSTSA